MDSFYQQIQGEQPPWLVQGCQVSHSTFHFWGSTSIPGKLGGVVDHSTMSMCMLSLFSRVWLFATLWTIAHQASLFMGLSRQEYLSGLPYPPPGDLPHSGIKPMSPMAPGLQTHFFTVEPLGKPYPMMATSLILFRGCHHGREYLCSVFTHICCSLFQLLYKCSWKLPLVLKDLRACALLTRLWIRWGQNDFL